MKPLARALSLLLCLLLVTTASVGAVLSVTGASGFGSPERDDCPLASLATFEGTEFHGPPLIGDEQPTSPDADEPASRPLHHHHFCVHCVMQAAVPASLPQPIPLDEVAPVSAPNPLKSAVVAQPLHPPRDRG